MSVGHLSGSLNTVAGAEHVFADTSVLKLGNHCISGDPTYYNTGGIEIVGTVSATEDLAIIAGGDITSDTNGKIVANGHNLLMIAGANITSACAGCTSPGPGQLGPTSGTSTPTSGLASGTVSVSLIGGTGGSIDLSNSTAATAIDTSSTTAAGGNVTLVALADPSGAKGQVIFNTGSNLGAINTSGAGSGGGGNVTIYAGASSLLPITSITTNQIETTSSGTLNSGSVTLQTTQAVTSDGQVLVLNAAGTISSGNTIQPGAAALAGIMTGNISTLVHGGSQAGGNVTIKAYGDIDTSAGTIATLNNGVGAAGELTITSSNGSVSTGGIYTFVYSGWLAAANVTISADGNITTNGNPIYAFQGGSGAGGTIKLTSSSGSVSTGILLTGVGDTVAAGNVIVSAQLNINAGDILAFNVGTGGGGTVNLTTSIGSILAGQISTNTLLGLVPAGNVTLSAVGGITVLGKIDASNAGISTGGSVSLLTLGSLTTGDIDTSTSGTLGGSITAAAANNNGVYSIAMGNLKTSGSAAAGFVEVVSTDISQKPTFIGTITTQASGSSGIGGAVGIATLGALAVGNIDTTNTSASASGAAQSGSVFLSSGSTAGGAILAGDIKAYNPANASATGQVILIASGTISVLGTITTSPGNSSVNPSYSSFTSSISSSTTIDVSVTGISGLFSNYNPQGYLFMSGGGTQLTINSGGNSSLLAPLLCLTNVSIDSINSNSGTQADGVAIAAFGDITLSGSTGVNTAGTTSGGNVNLLSIIGHISVNGLSTGSSGAGTAGNVSLSAYGNINSAAIVASNSGTGAGGTLTLNSSTGSVTTGSIDTRRSSAGSTTAGSVFISACQDIDTTGNPITAYNGGSGSGGTLMLTSGTGSVSIGAIDTYASGNGAAGNVFIAAFGGINTNSNSIAAYNGGAGSSGNVILISSNSSITAGAIDTHVASGSEKAADVTVSAYGDIKLTGALDAANTGSGSGCTVNLLSAAGKVTTGGINVDVTAASIVAGNVNIEASKDIDTSAGTIQAQNGSTRPIDGGVILLSHTESVKTGVIDISVTGGSAPAGDVSIMAAKSITALGAITASNSGTGAGGTIKLTSINSSVSFSGLDTHVDSSSAAAGRINISALDAIIANGAIDTYNAGNGASAGGEAGNVFLLSSTSSVSTVGINTNVKGGSAVAGNVTILADGYIDASGVIDTSNAGTGPGGNVALTSGNGFVSIGDIKTGVGGGSAAAGNLFILAPQAITAVNIATNNTGAGAGGSVALISKDKISILGTITSSGTPGGSVFLSSGFAGTDAIKTGAIHSAGGPLLATAATIGSITVQAFTDGSALSINAGQIYASGNYTSAINILPLNFSNSATATMTPAAVPGGGFASFSNSGTLSLANDAGTSGNVISFNNLVPVFVQGTVSSLGRINDSTGRANLFMVASTVNVSSATTFSSATGSLGILAGKAELAAVHTTGVNLQITSINDISTGTINTSNSYGTIAGNASLLSLGGSVTTGAIETYVSSGSQPAGNVSISAYGPMSTNMQAINASNSGTGAGGTVNLTTTGTGSIEIGHIETSINNVSSNAAAGNITVVAAAALDTNGQAINAFNSGTGAGGTVTLTSMTFSIEAGDIDTHVASGSAPAGNLFISSLQAIQTGNINASHGGAGTGGSVTLVRAASMATANIDTSSAGSAGGSITAGSVGDNNDYTLQMGNLKTSGFTSAGSIMLVGDDFGKKPLSVGNILAQASGPNGVGGSVGISGLGIVEVGTIDTTNTAAVASSGAQSGSVFLSSGNNLGIFGDSIVVAGGINAYNSSNGSATGQVILIASGTILTLGAITTSAGVIPGGTFSSNVVSGGQASISPNYQSNKLSISSSTTINVSVTGISGPSSNYNPSGYAALTGNNTVLTIDGGGNSSLLAPLVFTAFVPMVIKSINSNSHTAADGIALLVFGNLTLSDAVGINAAGTTSGGLVTLQSSAGLIFVPGINTASSGAGTAGNINISAWSTVPVSGTINASNSGTGAGGSVFLASTTDSVLTGEIDTHAANGSAAAGNLTISTYGAMVTGKLNASNGGTGAGGSVFLTSMNSSVTTGAIDTYTNGGAAAGGNVFISAYGNINTGKIQSYNSVGTGSGGAVSLTSTVGSVSTGEIDTYLTSGSGAVGNVTIASLKSISLGGDINTGTVSLSAPNIAISSGVTVSNTVADMLIKTSNLINQGALNSSGNIWVFTPTGSDLTVGGTGTMSASATVFGLSPASGGTVTNQNLYVTGNQTVTGDLGLFSSASGFPGVVSLSSGSSLSASTGINIDTPTLLNSGTLTASGTFTIPGVTPNPGSIGIFAQNQRASAGISIGGSGGIWNALAGGTYIQSLFPNGIVISGNQTFNGTLTLNAVGSGVSVNLGASISANGPATVNSSTATINGTFNFNAGGTINSTGDISGSGLLTASSGTLTLNSTGGNIGSIAQAIQTTAATISTSSLGKTFINDTNSNVVLLSITASDFHLTGNNINASQKINVSGALTLIANSGNLTFSGATCNLLDLRAIGGTLNLPSAQLAVNPDSITGDGGSINLVAANLVYPGAASSSLSLNAAGRGAGNGGAITIVLSSSKAVLINNALSGKNPPPTQVMALDCRPGSSGNGGTISVTTGGNLTVVPSYALAAPTYGNGAILTFSSGGNLLIKGTLSADAAGTGNGGSITLQSNSPSTFTIGATATTTVNGALKQTGCTSCPVLSVTGTTGNLNGSISITNLGGSVSNLVALTTVKILSLTAGAAGSVLVKKDLGSSATAFITLSATGSGNVTSTTSKIQATTLNLSASTGRIGSSTTPLQFSAGTVAVSAPGANGLVNLVDLATGNVVLAASIAGLSYKMSAPKASNVLGSGTITSPTISLAAAVGSIGAPFLHLSVNASTITLTAKGAVAVDNLSNSASVLNKSSGQSFTFTSGGNLTLKGITATNGAIDVQNNAGVMQTANGASIAATNGGIVLTNNDNSAAGKIIVGKSSRIFTKGTGGPFNITLAVGSGGSTSPVNPLPGTIRVITSSAGGQAFFSSAGTPGLSALAPINTINLKGSDVTLNSGANGSITLNGSVTLTADPIVVGTHALINANDRIYANEIDASSQIMLTPAAANSGAVSKAGAEVMVVPHKAAVTLNQRMLAITNFVNASNRVGSALICAPSIALQKLAFNKIDSNTAGSPESPGFPTTSTTESQDDLLLDTGEDADAMDAN